MLCPSQYIRRQHSLRVIYPVDMRVLSRVLGVGEADAPVFSMKISTHRLRFLAIRLNREEGDSFLTCLYPLYQVPHHQMVTA